MTRKLLFILFSQFLFSVLNASSPPAQIQYGLEFNSHESTLDLRTGLNLTPEKPISVDGNLDFSFKLKFTRVSNIYGYIFRMRTKDGTNIDLLSVGEGNAERNSLILLVGDSRLRLEYRWNDYNIQPNKWYQMRLSTDDKEVALSFNDKTQKRPLELPLNELIICFGKNDLPHLKTNDVPAIAIKDISISTSGNEIRRWPLNRHNHLEVFDDISNEKAIVINPNWLTDQHIAWNHASTIETSSTPQIAFDGEKFLLVTPSELITYDMNRGLTENHALGKNTPLPLGQQSIYLPEKDELWVFDIDAREINKFDVAEKNWIEINSNFSRLPDRWHVNRKLREDGSMLFFGGYGHYLFKNHLFEYADSTWQIDTLDTIEPRYLSSMGLNQSDEAFIFGGYGSATGKQELSPTSYYQLFKVNSDRQVEKLWELPRPGKDYVFSNSMIIESDSVFFVLKHPFDKSSTNLTLESYNIRTGEKIAYPDSISFNFHDITSYADLIYDAQNGQLIATLLEKSGDSYSTKFYTINYPPLTIGSIQQTGAKAPYPWLRNMIIALIISVSALLVLRRFNARKTKKKNQTGAEKSVQDHAHPMESTPLPEKKVPAILFLGGFQVLDKNGEDISQRFTLKVRHLLAMLLLHSAKNDKGITSSYIWEMLWPEKSENSARNNRNVNLKKVRLLLSELGDFEVKFVSERWTLELDPNVFFDFSFAYEILEKKLYPAETLVQLAKNGRILPGIEAEWVDGFKSEFSNKLIDGLLEISKSYAKDDPFQIEIADAIFLHDQIDQNALIIKCTCLNLQGKYAIAKETYTNFVREYKLMYEEDYETSLEDLIS